MRFTPPCVDKTMSICLLASPLEHRPEPQSLGWPEAGCRGALLPASTTRQNATAAGPMADGSGVAEVTVCRWTIGYGHFLFGAHILFIWATSAWKVCPNDALTVPSALER